LVKAALEVVVVWMATCSRMVVGYVRDCVGDARTVCASSSREFLPGPPLIIRTAIMRKTPFRFLLVGLACGAWGMVGLERGVWISILSAEWDCARGILWILV
jgi:hypothetical protein